MKKLWAICFSLFLACAICAKAADTYTLATNPDGSAVLTVTFDTTGITCDPSLALNYTPFVLAAKSDSSAWTLADAQTTLAAEINAARVAFDAAAPSFVPPAPIVPDQ